MESRDWLYVFGAAALVGVVALGAAAAGEPAITVGPDDRVLLIGDSLAQGLTPPLRALAEDAGVAFQGDGRVSTRLDQWLGQGWAEADLASFRPTVLLVSLGTNDAGAPGLLPDFAARAQALALLAASYGARVLWVEPPAMPFPTEAVLSGIRASGAAATYRSQDTDIPRGPDNIHPTMGGYAEWAGRMWISLSPPPGRAVRRRLGSKPASGPSLGRTPGPRSSSTPTPTSGLSSLSNRMHVYSGITPRRSRKA